MNGLEQVICLQGRGLEVQEQSFADSELGAPVWRDFGRLRSIICNWKDRKTDYIVYLSFLTSLY